jgi:hypothetical protein
MRELEKIKVKANRDNNDENFLTQLLVVPHRLGAVA